MKPDWVRDRLSAVVRDTPAGGRIVLDQWEQDGGTITATATVDALAARFADVDTDGTPTEVRDRLLAADTVHLDADGNEVPPGDPAAVDTASHGYAAYIIHWHGAGLLGPPDTPDETTLPSGRAIRLGRTADED